MAAVQAWTPAGKGEFVELDWGRVPDGSTFDAYLCWHDFTGSLWTRGGPSDTRLIVALKKALDPRGVRALKKNGLLVMPHYAKRATGPQYVTGVCPGATDLRKFCRAAQDPSDEWIGRYEVSEGFLQPGFDIEGGATPPDPAPCGTQALVGFVDYGCAFANRQFLCANGTLRMHALWDQQESDRPPPKCVPLGWRANAGFGYGRTVDRAALSTYIGQFRSPATGLLDESACYRDAQYEPILRSVTHGTHVMDVATGHRGPLRHRASGRPAPEPHRAAIAFVQLPRYRDGAQISGLLKAQVLDAVHFIAALRAADKTAVVNLSYGSYCGPHDGTSILEMALDELILGSVGADQQPRLHVVVPAGNASLLACHAQVHIGTLQRQVIAWTNVPDDPSESFVEVWVPDDASLRVRVTPPGSAPSAAAWAPPNRAVRLQRDGDTVAMLIHSTRPCQSTSGQMILFATRRTSGPERAPCGTWQIEIENLGPNPVLVDAWCERDDPVFGTEGGPRQAHFKSHVERTGTLNSIAHGRHTVVVGGYDVHSGASVSLAGPVSEVSSSGPGRGLGGRLRHPPDEHGAAKNGPEVLAPCNLGLGEAGVPGAAVFSGDQVRLMGTSVAAAAYTRWMLDPPSRQTPPTQTAGGTCPPSPPRREPHPDDCLGVPRIP